MGERSEVSVGCAGLTAGVDLGDRFSQVCVVDALGRVVAEHRLATTAAAFRKHFEAAPRMRVAMEAGTHSPWASRLVAAAGHELVVANPRRVRSISTSVKKSDRVDAEQLARLARSDVKLLAPIRHRDAAAQQDLCVIHSRDLLVRSRQGLAQHVRCTLKSFGIRTSKHSMPSFAGKIEPLLPKELAPALQPVLAAITELSAKIRAMDRALAEMAETRHPQVAHLTDINGVGTLTALAFVLTLADATRFKRSRDVGAYLGLTPRRRQSGDRDPQLRITKAGDSLMRRLLVGSAHYVLGPFGKDCDLRDFGMRLVAHGGKCAKKRAVVAVARKLAALLHRLWVTGEVYDPERTRRRQTTARCVA